MNSINITAVLNVFFSLQFFPPPPSLMFVYHRIILLFTLCYSSLAWRVRPKHYAVDGLSSVRYDRDVVEKRSLYTWIHVTLPEPPQNFKGYRRSNSAGVALRWSMTQLVMTLLLVVVVKHTA